MKLFFLLLLSLWTLLLNAKNLEVTAQLFMAPSDLGKKNVNGILSDPQAQKLFSAKITCLPGAMSSCYLKNHFEFQSSGFQFQTTPSPAQRHKKTTRLNVGIDWNLQEEGPFLASASESFYDGTVIHCTRSILPGVFSPLGINQSKDAKLLYIPALQFSGKAQKRISSFRYQSKWEIKIIVQEEGETPKIVRTVPYYHRGRFPVRNPVGIQCRMSNFRGITVMNMYYTHQRGLRKNGKPVTEELGLTLCFAAPGKGEEIQLADLTSYCFADRAAFSKLPKKGGKPIRYQVFLTVK